MLALSSQPELIDALRQRLLVWEADCRSTGSSFSSGAPALDRILPENGLRRRAFIEYVAESGSGATLLSLIAAREACRDGRTLVIVDHQRRFNPPAAANLGIDLTNAIFVRPRTRKDQLWALNQSLRCGGVGAVVSWADKLDDRASRALQLAVEAGEAVGLIMRPIGVRGRPTWSGMQLLVEALPAVNAMRRMRVEVLRCRNSPTGASVEVELDDETGAIQESRVVPLASSVAARAAASRSPGA